MRGFAGALEEIEGEEDGEDAIAVVNGVGVDAVDAKEDERSGEKCGDEECAVGEGLEQAEEDAPGEEGCEAGFEGGAEDVREVDAAEELDDAAWRRNMRGAWAKGKSR